MMVEKMFEPVAIELLRKQMGTRITQITDIERNKMVADITRNIKSANPGVYAELGKLLNKNSITCSECAKINGHNMLKLQSTTIWKSVVNCYFLSFPPGTIDSMYLTKALNEFNTQSFGTNVHKIPNYLFKGKPAT